MKSKAPDKSLQLITWNWPCTDVVLSALPQFETTFSPELTEQFWNGLSRSPSLSVEEKLRVIHEVPKLSAMQIHQLIEVWDDELRAFQLLFETEFSTVSKVMGGMAIGWLLIWEKLGFKKDQQEISVIWQFVDIHYSGGFVQDFKLYVKNTYFWLGCINAMNKHGHTESIDRVLAILEKTLNDSNFGFPSSEFAEQSEVVTRQTEPLTQ